MALDYNDRGLFKTGGCRDLYQEVAGRIFFYGKTTGCPPLFQPEADFCFLFRTARYGIDLLEMSRILFTGSLIDFLPTVTNFECKIILIGKHHKNK